MFVGYLLHIASLTQPFQGGFIISSYASANCLNLSVNDSFCFSSAFGFHFHNVVSSTLTMLSFLLGCCSACRVGAKEKALVHNNFNRWRINRKRVDEEVFADGVGSKFEGGVWVGKLYQVAHPPFSHPSMVGMANVFVKDKRFGLGRFDWVF